jgi:hypothetical protein
MLIQPDLAYPMEIPYRSYESNQEAFNFLLTKIVTYASWPALSRQYLLFVKHCFVCILCLVAILSSSFAAKPLHFIPVQFANAKGRDYIVDFANMVLARTYWRYNKLFLYIQHVNAYKYYLERAALLAYDYLVPKSGNQKYAFNESIWIE